LTIFGHLPSTLNFTFREPDCSSVHGYFQLEGSQKVKLKRFNIIKVFLNIFFKYYLKKIPNGGLNTRPSSVYATVMPMDITSAITYFVYLIAQTRKKQQPSRRGYTIRQRLRVSRLALIRTTQ